MTEGRRAASPHARGVALALAAALGFGLSTPLVARVGAGFGPFATAALLYGGAAIAGLLFRRASAGHGHRLGRADAPRLAVVALLGAVVAPTLLAWGLQRTGATGASLVLNLEAVFTMALAALFFGEPIGRRAGLAAAVMLGGGLLLVLDAQAEHEAATSLLGLLAVGGATLAWAGDNAVSRGLSEAEPLAVVGGKGLLGAALTATLALASGEAWGSIGAALALGAIGLVGYGLSLALYLVAQRSLGAARTASVFALGPFLGAALALALGDRQATFATLGAGLCFGLGVWIHLHEPHAHDHVHEPLEHEHFHRHADGHHDDHAHGPDAPQLVRGGHSHRHAHTRRAHGHAHAPDLHHRHPHG